MNSLMSLLLVILALAAIAGLFSAWSKGFRFSNGFRSGRSRKANPFRILAANLAEGENLNGQKSMTATSTLAFRFSVAKAVPATPGTFDTAVAADKPLGICRDQATAGEPCAIDLIPCCTGTKKVSINSTVNNDDWLTCDAGGYARSLPTANGTYWVFGKAILPSANAGAGDIIEFIPCFPVKVVVVSTVGTATFP